MAKVNELAKVVCVISPILSVAQSWRQETPWRRGANDRPH